MLVFNNTQMVKKSIIFLHCFVVKREGERERMCVCVYVCVCVCVCVWGCVNVFAGVTKPTFESFYTGFLLLLLLLYLVPAFIYICCAMYICV